ncbi:MAG: hypothetical protein H7835_15595 [Magnetococcus sp. XQGC-1]
MNGDWETLRQANTPAVLTLARADKSSHFATVTGLGKTKITLRFARRQETMLLRDLTPYWTGKMTILRRATAGNKSRQAADRPAPTLQPIREDANE